MARTGTAMTPYEEANAKDDTEILLEPQDPQPDAPATRTSQFGWAARARWLLLGTGVTMVMLMLAPHNSAMFLAGVSSDAFGALRSELEHQQIPTIGMAHFSKEAGKVLCVIDVGQSVGRIMGLGAFANAASTACDYGRIARINKRPVTNRERQICASTAFGIMLQTELLIGAVASSISTCSGTLNVPANCVANVAVFNGALSVLMQSTLAGDAVCNKKGTIDARVNKQIARFEKKKDRAKIEATQFLKRQGYDVAVLPRPPAIGNRAVYSSINRCVFQTILGTTFVMKAAILLGDSTIHCYPGTDKQRVCAVDIMGLFAVLSLAVRFLSFAGDSCIDIIGRTDDNALCVGLWAGVPGGVLGMAAAGTNLEAACKTAFGKWVPEDWPYEGANMLPSDDFAALAEA